MRAGFGKNTSLTVIAFCCIWGSTLAAYDRDWDYFTDSWRKAVPTLGGWNVEEHFDKDLAKLIADLQRNKDKAASGTYHSMMAKEPLLSQYQRLAQALTPIRPSWADEALKHYFYSKRNTAEVIGLGEIALTYKRQPAIDASATILGKLKAECLDGQLCANDAAAELARIAYRLGDIANGRMFLNLALSGDRIPFSRLGEYCALFAMKGMAEAAERCSYSGTRRAKSLEEIHTLWRGISKYCHGGWKEGAPDNCAPGAKLLKEKALAIAKTSSNCATLLSAMGGNGNTQSYYMYGRGSETKPALGSIQTELFGAAKQCAKTAEDYFYLACNSSPSEELQHHSKALSLLPQTSLLKRHEILERMEDRARQGANRDSSSFAPQFLQLRFAVAKAQDDLGRDLGCQTSYSSVEHLEHQLTAAAEFDAAIAPYRKVM